MATLGIKPITFWYAPNNLAMLAHTYTHAHTPTNLPLHICTIELCQYYICINQWFKFIYGWHRKYTHALTPMLHKYYPMLWWTIVYHVVYMVHTRVKKVLEGAAITQQRDTQSWCHHYTHVFRTKFLYISMDNFSRAVGNKLW